MSDRSKHSLEVINGNTHIVSPLSLKDFDLAEEAALKQYKRRILQTFTENADLANGAISENVLMAKFEEVSLITASEMPKKKLVVFDRDKEGKIQYIENNGKVEPKMKTINVDYSVWWFSNTIAGKLLGVWLSVRKENPEVTLESIDRDFRTVKVKNQGPFDTSDEELAYDEEALERIAQKIGEVSRPTAGTIKND